MERLDEKNKDEADSVSNVLGIIENIIEVKPGFTLDSTKQGLLQWLLKRIKVKQTFNILKFLYNFYEFVILKVKGSFDSNKLYAAELISILVQNQDDNRKLLGDLDGIDILLRQIAVKMRLYLFRMLIHERKLLKKLGLRLKLNYDI